MTKPIPDGYPVVTPYLSVDRAADAIDFYTKAFGAQERMRMPAPDGKIGHAEMMLGESVVMLADESPDMGLRSPKSVNGTSVFLSIYVEDVDAIINQAVALGATVIRPVEDQFYGDRQGQIEDPFGHRWAIATHIEDVSPEEMQRRVATAMGSG